MPTLLSAVDDVFVYGEGDLFSRASYLVFTLKALQGFFNNGSSLADAKGPAYSSMTRVDLDALVAAAEVINKYYEPKRLIDLIHAKVPIFNGLTVADKQALVGSQHMPDLSSLLPDIAEVIKWINISRQPTNTPKPPKDNETVEGIKFAVVSLNPYGREAEHILNKAIVHNDYHKGYNAQTCENEKSRTGKKLFDISGYCPVDGVTKQIITRGNTPTFKHQSTKGSGGQPMDPDTGELYLFTEECRSGGHKLYHPQGNSWLTMPLNESPLYIYHARAWARRVYARTLARFKQDVDPVYGMHITHYQNELFDNAIPLYMMELAKDIDELEKSKNSEPGTKDRKRMVTLYSWFFDADQKDPSALEPLPDVNNNGRAIVRFYRVRECPYYAGLYEPDIYDSGRRPITVNELKMMFLFEAAYWFSKQMEHKKYTRLAQWAGAYDANIGRLITDEQLARYRQVNIQPLVQPQPAAPLHVLTAAPPTPSDTTMSEEPKDEFVDEVMTILNSPASSAVTEDYDSEFAEHERGKAKADEYIAAFKAKRLTGDWQVDEGTINAELDKIDKIQRKHDGAMYKGLLIGYLHNKLFQLWEALNPAGKEQVVSDEEREQVTQATSEFLNAMHAQLTEMALNNPNDIKAMYQHVLQYTLPPPDNTPIPHGLNAAMVKHQCRTWAMGFKQRMDAQESKQKSMLSEARREKALAKLTPPLGPHS